MRFSVWALIAIGFVHFCTSNSLHAETPPAAHAPSETKAQLREKKLGYVKNVHVLGDIYLAGQPTPADLPLLKQQGFKTIINLRRAEEVPWDEATAVKQLGMDYVHLPFQKPEGLTQKVFDEALRILRDKKSEPTLLHCASANRVGAIWYAHRVLNDKLAPEAALKEAKTVGLRTPALLQKAQQYVEQKSASTSAEVTPKKVPPIK